MKNHEAIKQEKRELIDHLRSLIEKIEASVHGFSAKQIISIPDVREYPENHPEQIATPSTLRYLTGRIYHNVVFEVVVPIPEDDRVEGLEYAEL